MKQVTLDRDELLEKLKANREKHYAIFQEAFIGYRKLAIKKLDEALADAKAGKKIQLYIELVEPVNQTEDYDRVIAMLEMSLEDEVVLTQTEFAQYVLDQWHWKEQFKLSNSLYTTTALE